MSKFKLGAWFHRAGKLLRGRTFTAAGLAVAVGLSLWAVAENVKILYIADGAETGVTLALRSDPTEQALSRAGITLKENDTVTTRETALVYSRVSISRGVSVTLVADGRETPCTVTGGTVAELLEQNSITLGENDYCDKELSALLEDGDVITVRRVEKKVVKEQVAIPCDTVYKSSSLLRNGRSMLITEGDQRTGRKHLRGAVERGHPGFSGAGEHQGGDGPPQRPGDRRPARRGDLPAGLERPIPAGRQWHPGEL